MTPNLKCIVFWYFRLRRVKFAQSCLTLCNPMDYTVHGILQARILEWVAVPFSRGLSQPRNWTQVSHIAGGFFTSWAFREEYHIKYKICYLWIHLCFPGDISGKESTCSAEHLGSIPGSEDPLKKCMATHSSILAWRIPWTEEPGRLQSIALQTVRQDWSSGTAAQYLALWPRKMFASSIWTKGKLLIQKKLRHH